MRYLQSLSWAEPLEVAAGLHEETWVLLYSGAKSLDSGRYSYLAFNKIEEVLANDFSKFSNKISHDQPKFDNCWFGYFGYGLKNCLEELNSDQPNWLNMPDLHMIRFASIIQFDHEEKRIHLWSSLENPKIPQNNAKISIYPHRVKCLNSNMTKSEYLEKAAEIIRLIHQGDLYQANLTRKFYGEFDQQPNSYDLFRNLCEVSPAPYSCYMQLKDVAILSSSPELFLKADGHGHIVTRPIKGTSPRYDNDKLDRLSAASLSESAKDRAENLMIVDLMRNDIARTCYPGSIRVERLFDVTTHATVHHMSSTISGIIINKNNILDTIKACFPPGSMTGAPKIKAINVCSHLEGLERGVYSGAIGWLGGDGSCELSVVIRTLIIKGRQFEFQVGGGIVADSSPESEFEEIKIKSKGILQVLGVTEFD